MVARTWLFLKDFLVVLSATGTPDSLYYRIGLMVGNNTILI